MRGRVTHGCYRQLGVMDGVVERVEAYAERAVRIATDRDLRHALSARIVERGAELFEDARALAALEDFFADVVARGAR
jgi:predicted O-linked N-acetylglucosamine transferase (SPINDLY family)